MFKSNNALISIDAYLCKITTGMAKWIACIIMAFALSSCLGSETKTKSGYGNHSHINNTTKFSSKAYGVKGSPRVTTVKRPRKGGGRYQIGKSYTIKGKRYYPKDDPGLKQTGMASWYGPNFHGRLTANGEIYDQYSLSAAHPTMPLPSYARVTNLENGRAVTVRVNDRGPFARGRVIDLSAQAAKMLGYTKQGLAKVNVKYVGKARMDGKDEKQLMASYQGPDGNRPFAPQTSTSGTLIAMAEPIPSINAQVAISDSFAPSQTIAFSNVPLPTVRPTLFEGVPMHLGSEQYVGEQIYQIRPRPLAFYPDQRDNLRDFESDISSKLPYLGENPDRVVTIELGQFRRGTDLGQLSEIFNNNGLILRDKNTSMILFRTDEKSANLVLEFARINGLLDVHIR